MNEIEKTREEILEGCGTLLYTFSDTTDVHCGDIRKNKHYLCDECKDKLKGFNLGVQLAQKQGCGKEAHWCHCYRNGYKLAHKEFLELFEKFNNKELDDKQFIRKLQDKFIEQFKDGGQQ